MGFRSALNLAGVVLSACMYVMPAAAWQSKPAGAIPPPGDSPAASGLATPPTSLPPIALDRYVGSMVRNIEFRGTAPEQVSHLLPRLAVQPGQRLEKSALRNSVRTLFATGRFADIEVEAEAAGPQELTLVFVVRENFFIGQLTMAGAPKDGPTNHQLLNSTKLLLGESFREDSTRNSGDEAIGFVKRMLQENGYYNAQVTYELVRHPERQQVDVHFLTRPGEQARVGKVTVDGDPGFPQLELQQIMKLHPGDRASKSRADRALQRLQKRYQKDDRLQAEVSLQQRRYDPAANTVDYMFLANRNALVDIRLEGVSLRKGVLKRLIPVYEENAVDNDLLNEGRRNLRDYFQARGYFDVKIEYTQRQELGRLVVVYDVNRGTAHKLAAVDVDWTEVVARPRPYFSADDIHERMQVQAAGRPFIQGIYSQSLLAHDLDAITNLYRANGFQQVKVTSEVQDNYGGVSGRMRVVVHIREGPQTLVQALTIRGNEHVSMQELLGLVNTTEGQPWSDFNVAGDRDAIMNFYFNRGFPEVSLVPVSIPVAGDPPRMDVAYTIREGQQVFVNRVRISGLEHTKEFVVGRELNIHDGDALDQSAIMESQTNLYNMGIFNEVDVAVQNPEGNDTRKDVLFDIKEARRWTFNYGLGFEVQTGSQPNNGQPQGRTGWSPRASFDLTRINFRGRNHTLLFRSHVGRLEQRALFTAEVPRWFDRKNLKLSFTTFYDNSNDTLTFTSQRLEGAMQVEQRWSRATTLLYRFSYRQVRALNLAISPDLVPLYSKPTRIGMPTFTYIRDTRDNPLDSRRGTYNTVDMGVSSNYFGSQASYTRLLTQNSTYHPFYKKKIVLARSTRFGVENPIAYHGSPLAIIPLPELLFAGGGNSHRGFSINQAGPRDLQTGYPLGGEALFTNNVELRLPPPWLPFFENRLSPVIFWDFGNTFGSASDMFRSFLKFSQKNENCTPSAAVPSCDFNFMSHALGGGIRYNTPIGPVRFDIGYNLNPPTYLILQQNRTDQLRHLNFYFSIGQTF